MSARTWYARTATTLVLLIVLAGGCGGGGGTPVDPDSVTPEVREEAMDAVGTRVDALPVGATVEASVRSVGAYLATRPEFEQTGFSVEDGVAWGRFYGGVVYAVDLSPDTVAEATNAASVRQTTGERTGIAQGPAVLYHTLPAPHVDVAAIIRPWVLSAGYSVNAGPGLAATVPNLKSVRGVGLFYLGTHGMWIEGGWAKPQWVALTGEEPTRETQRLYAEDLADGSLAIVDRAFAAGRMRRYAFGAKFVRDHMRFGTNSLVYMDACKSALGDGFQGACFDAGASVYAGWDQNVHENAVARATPFMFDRMLSWNDPDNAADGPPARPFDYGDAYAELKLRGWEDDQWGVAILRFTAGPGQGAWLRPSIECLRVDEAPTGAASGQSELVVRGNFGADPGEGPIHAARSVSCGGQELSLISWQPDEIHASLPVYGPGSAGDVVVSVRGVKSNTVPLTEWRVTLTYRVGAAPNSGSTAYTQFVIDCHLRYDIHGWRETPTGAIRFTLPELQEQVTPLARDTYGSFQCGGDKAVYHPETGAFTYKIIYSGSGQLPYLASGLGNGCSGSSRLHYEYVGTEPVPGGNVPILFIRATVFAAGYPGHSYLLWADGTMSNETDYRIALNEYSNGTTVISQGQEFDLVIGEDGAIQAGQAGYLSWQRTLPRFQPTAATPRSR